MYDILDMCMYVCVYIYICTCIYIYYIYACVYKEINKCRRMYVLHSCRRPAVEAQGSGCERIEDWCFCLVGGGPPIWAPLRVAASG